MLAIPDMADGKIKEATAFGHFTGSMPSCLLCSEWLHIRQEEITTMTGEDGIEIELTMDPEDHIMAREVHIIGPGTQVPVGTRNRLHLNRESEIALPGPVEDQGGPVVLDQGAEDLANRDIN